MLQFLKQYFRIEYLLLFLCAFEFYNKTNYIIIILFLYLIIRYKTNVGVLLNSYLPCIVLFSISYFILGKNTISFSDPFVWIMSYFIGLVLCTRHKMEHFTSLFIIIGIATALNGVLIYLNGYQIIEFGDRVTVDLWGRTRPGTSSACSFLIYSGILYFIVTNKNIKLIFKILALGTIIFIPLNAVLISSRSALIYPFIIFIISYLSTINSKNAIKLIFILLTLVILSIIIYQNNYWGIKSFFESTFLYERLESKHDGGIVDNSRFHIWEEKFSKIMDNFWGGGVTVSGTNEYMHNIILDTIAYGGFPTAVILVIFMIHNIKNVIYIYKTTKTSYEKSCLIGITCAFYIIFMFEPIIQASNWYFCLYLFFAGVIDQQRKKLKY